MNYKLKSVAFHITNECSSNCPMCYYTKEKQVRCEGNLEVLKRIALELKNAGVEEINLVGGDPAEYSKIQDLVEYLHDLGFRIPILSNTHNYKNTSIERITPFITSLESTFHAPTAKEHDAFNRTKGSYEMMLENLKKYDSLRKSNQTIGAVLNVMNYNFNRLLDIVKSLLEQGLYLDYVLIQRIGLYGRAEGAEKEKLLRDMLITVFSQIDRINRELGIESLLVDAFPLCLIPEEFHKYTNKCDWGFSTACLDMNGDISRCAVADHNGENLLGNVLETSVVDIWDSAPTLISFRNKDYLREECQKCDNLAKCGGSCPMSQGSNVLLDDELLLQRKQNK